MPTSRTKNKHVSNDIVDNLHSSVYTKEANRFLNMIQNTSAHVSRMKEVNVFNGNELNQCLKSLESTSNRLHKLMLATENSSVHDAEDKLSLSKALSDDEIISELQLVNNELASVFRLNGTMYMKDLLSVCLGNSFLSKMDTDTSYVQKLKIVMATCHPIGYKLLSWKDGIRPEPDATTVLRKNCIVEDTTIVEHAKTMDCFDLGRTCKEFYKRVHGIKIVIQNPSQRKTLIISAITDNVPTWSIASCGIDELTADLHHRVEISGDGVFSKEEVTRFIGCLTIKDLLVYSNDDLWNRYVGYCTQARLIRQQPLSQVVKEFIPAERYSQRTTILQLLVKSSSHEFQYLAYLLYDLLSSDTNNSVDTMEQTELFDSLPILAKQLFKDALQSTVNYSNKLTNFDSNKIPLEQQICLMKASDSVKERAMQKLKEVKNKNEDSGTKARQYLEGLLRIPFGVYRKEPILGVMDRSRCTFTDLVEKLRQTQLKTLLVNIPCKEKYTSIEIKQYLTLLKKEVETSLFCYLTGLLIDFTQKPRSRAELSELIGHINGFIRDNEVIKRRKIPVSGQSIESMRKMISEFIDQVKHQHLIDIASSKVPKNEICQAKTEPATDIVSSQCSESNAADCTSVQTVYSKSILLDLCAFLGVINNFDGQTLPSLLNNGLVSVANDQNSIQNYITEVSKTLKQAVHGHKRAKRQVERIIGQWINGEQSGYCFGFEGPPGVGKTSLAKKGIANCLRDSDGSSRPFCFIAIGGGSNGCTLEGHNYTYVASTWGRIVDVLMEKKCMNPIIFIDELDKVSRTEHGKEIIGILTHLIDPSQNDTFQDKYFNGIDLDLSQALFIFSYNDVDAIDRILLDRIHRVKFDALTLDDKLVIAKEYLLPEVLEKMGLTDMISFTDEVLTMIIESYTYEPGVRKFKELLFEIVGEVNISSLRNEKQIEIPYVLTCDEVKHVYLKERDIIRPYKVKLTEPKVGLINGLYANGLGKGGVLPIETSFVPSTGMFELQLTGMQGDVMKESMQVARTLALKLAEPFLPPLLAKHESGQFKPGIHIHVPEGATKKDGPSAGAAITMAIYSLLTGQPIHQHTAVTGEICLGGHITAIGGLEQKVLGGIKAGATTFLYPEENQKDYEKIVETYGPKGILDNITFHSVSNIDEAMFICVEGFGDC